MTRELKAIPEARVSPERRAEPVLPVFRDLKAPGGHRVPLALLEHPDKQAPWALWVPQE